MGYRFFASAKDGILNYINKVKLGLLSNGLATQFLFSIP